MSSFIHGIASCSAIDTSGEVVDIKGIDISSLPRTGVINWEHKADTPAQLVGKITKAKKIFDQKDCSDEHERHFWNKVRLPFVYIVAELLDDYTDSARECAGQMRYSKDHPEQMAILGFSVEGSEIPGTRVNKMLITRSIARKVTLTASPANKACVAEILENQKPQIRDDFEEIFKSEQNAIEMFKTEKGVKIYEEFLAKKEAQGPSTGGRPPKAPGSEYGGQGVKVGTNKAGKHVYSHGNIASYSFNPSEHKHTGEHHERAVVSAQNPKLDENKEGRAIQHDTATKTNSIVQNRAALSLKDKDKIAAQQGKQQISMSEKVGNLKKAQVPGSKYPPANEVTPKAKPEGYKDKYVPVKNAPKDPGSLMGSTKSGKKVFSHARVGDYGFNSGEHHEAAGMHQVASQNAPTTALKNHHWDKMKLHTQAAHTSGLKENRFNNAMADKRKMVQSMKKSLTAGSTNAAPSTLVNGSAYQSENLRKESAKTGMEDHKFQGTKKKDWKKRAKEDYENWPQREKFESFLKARMPHLNLGEIQAIGRAVCLKKSIEMEKSLSQLNKALKVKEPFESEVVHVKTEGGHTPVGYKEHDTVHLKSGHVLDGHPKGKFKIGDKVQVRPHIMGTHVMEHKK